MEDAVQSVRADFYSSFAHVLNRDCGIPYCDAGEHWNAYARQLSYGAREEAELGGPQSGRKEGERFAESFTTNA
jgi:hypothetical protein